MNTIPSEQVARLGVHFSFSELNILPNNVLCDVTIKGRRKLRKQGEIILRARNVQVSPCLVGLITNNLKSVFCEGEWIQDSSNEQKDFYRTHFVYVREQDRDCFKAMKHDAENANVALEHLTRRTWDIIVWQNGIGRFDIFCNQSSTKRPEAILLFDQESLRCTS